MSIGEMQPIYGRVFPEPPPQATPSPPFLFRVHRHKADHSALRVVVTNFQSTFEVIKSRHYLEDMRDDIGIGGSWSEFIDYVITSLKSGDVKLIMEGSSKSGGADYAKLIAQKAKGMPRVSFSFSKLVDGSAGEAMANLSLELYKEFNDVKSLLIEEKSDTLQKQLDMVLYSRNHKFQKINDRGISNSASVMVSQNSPDVHTEKNAAQDPSSRKGSDRVVPAHRRSKVRGAVLNDTEDDAQS